MTTEQGIVDDRVFLLGLDKLYRDAMKEHERGELLKCARRVAEVLRVSPARVPVEGYYAEDRQLTEYFRLMRALQRIEESARPKVKSLDAFERLLAVASAPLFGRPHHDGKLIPTGRDALWYALKELSPNWTLTSVTAAATKQAAALDDFSLVGLAARVKDSVVLAATRESVVLYLASIRVGLALDPPRPRYVWNVDKELVEQAKRFLGTFEALFGNTLPQPGPAQAEHYWHAYKQNEIVGRCVRIGFDDRVVPTRHYHWAIRRAADGEFAVQEFWDPEIWTTERYSRTLLHRVL